jgi:hypothetical protein
MRPIFAAAFLTVFSTSAFASSHREAPFITQNPKVDNTDFYMFNSYEAGRGNFVTVISNFQPLQAPYGGPNYFTMDPQALYEIHIDNTGDSVEDITFQFQFQNTLANGGQGIPLPIAAVDGGSLQMVAIPLINAGVIGGVVTDGGVGPLQGQYETYNVNIVRGPRRTGTVSAVKNADTAATTFAKPFENVGSKTFPPGTYDTYAKAFMYNISIPGCTTPGRMFVGTRKEGFAVNLGPVFDLINAPAAVITNDADRGAGGPNPIGYANVTTIALELDKACVQPSATEHVIGGWSSASLRQARVLNPTPNYSNRTREGGPWVQVSRLGSPLVNEAVIGVPDKDLFNSSEPKNDLTNFVKYVTNPTLPKLIEILFAAPAPTAIPRLDLVAAFASGVPGVNAFGGNPIPGEMLRLNTGIPATPKGMQNSLGALQCFTGQTATMAPTITLPPGNALCDPAGFPNGRRPGDDTVDIILRVAMGALLPLNDAPAGNVPFHDAILQQDSDFDAVFPYMKTPNAGTP